jgi:quinoprotein glucose dehydrogenase
MPSATDVDPTPERLHARKTACALFAVMLGCIAAALVTQPVFAWEHWGGDRGGTRFSGLQQITPDNVSRLVRAWQFRTGDLARRGAKTMAFTKFEATPLFVEDSLILCTTSMK